MKKQLCPTCIAVLALFCAAVAGSVIAQPGPDWLYGMGPGMMGGYGLGYGMGPGMMDGIDYGTLGLSTDQKSKIEQIRREARAKHLALLGKMLDAQDHLQELYDADKPDSAAINNQYKEIEELRRQMVDTSIDARNRVDALLTKEQREKSRELRRSHGSIMWGY